MSTIEKRLRETDLTDLRPPVMSDDDWRDLRQGIDLFNTGEFWHAHEVWEAIWIRHSENSRIFFQGLIQVAAGLHQLRRGIYHGVDKHLRNALWKLEPFQPNWLGIRVDKFIVDVKNIHAEANALGEENLAKFDGRFPQIAADLI